MTNNLKIAIQNLYQTFSNYGLRPDIESCPCCVTEAANQQLKSKLLNQLSVDDISHYFHKAMTTWGTLMVWNYYDADVLSNASPVTVTIKNIPAKKILLQHYRIDKDNSNAYEAWKQMGSPQNVTDAQYKQLEYAGQLQLLNSPEWINTIKGEAVIQFSLPRQGVSLLRMTYQ